MRAFGARGLVLVGALALTLAACSSGNGDGQAAKAPASEGPAAEGGCAAAAGLSGPIEDRGTATASGGAITLDASEFAFSLPFVCKYHIAHGMQGVFLIG